MDRRAGLRSAPLIAAAVAVVGLLLLGRECGLTCVALGLVAGLGHYLVAARHRREFRRHMRELSEAMTLITIGGYGHKLYGQIPDALGAGRAFNAMSDHLTRQFDALEDERQQLRAILSGMVEGVVFIDAQERVRYANERAGELLDIVPKLAVGHKLWEVVRLRPILDLMAQATASDTPQRAELEARAGARSLALYAARLPGTPSHGAILVLHDITELRRLERVRQEFVANVSHELKTPLAVIQACAETLLAGAADDPAHRDGFIRQIDEQGQRLHSLILDLLSLGRIESGAVPLDVQPVPLADAVADCLDRHRARADGKGQRLDTADSPAADVLADAEALDTILDNLVDNAIKYTPAGGVIWVRWSNRAADTLLLEVEDTGIGIAERDLPRVFERFYRADKARSREVGGTGLGLAIVKHLVQAMRGTVAVRSTPGRGTKFSVRLPRPAARAEPEPSAAASAVGR